MRWLIGALALASIAMSMSLVPIITHQIRDTTVKWYRNTALRLSSAMFLHSFGGVVLFTAMWSPGFKIGSQGIALYGVAFAYALWLLSKSLIISVGNGLKLYLFMLLAWSVLSVYEGWL